MLSKEAFDALGPVFASHGWVFFGPYRRGQGLSASAGPYIGDQIAAAEKSGGISAGAAAMVRLLEAPGARIAVAYDSCGSKCQCTNFLFPSCERL